MDFGLGLILSFTDNATGGIQNAVNSLNQLTETASNASSSLNEIAQLGAFSVVANQMGSSLMQAGSGILSMFTQIIGKVNETGQTLMYAENQLNMLYRDGKKTGKDVLGDIAEYAKSSLFEYEDLIPVVTMLKANGIEAFDQIASSTEKSRQTLMDYAADLAAFNPQMRNAYGTGIQAAMGALNEYIAEGNARSLKAGASLDITALLGEDKGKSIEERSRQVADLMEQLNMVGISASLAESPMVKLGNISDTLFQFMGMVSDSGVYETFSRMVSSLGEFVGSIPDNELEALAQSIGSALTMLMKPIEFLEGKLLGLADAFKDLLANNPEIAKFVTVATAIAGALMLVSGVALKFASTIGMLTIGLCSFGNSFSTISTLLRSGVLKILGALLPFTVAIGLMYLTWKNDFGGIRTLLTNFVSDLRGAFGTARQALNMNVNGMMGVVNDLQNKGDFWSNFTVGLIKVGTIWQALCDAWSDYTLSEDLFLKCKELGVLPLIEAILDLKWRVEHFIAGFRKGFDSALSSIINFAKGLASNLEGTIFDTLIDKATKFFQLLINNDPEAWTRLGEIVGGLAAKFMVAWAALKVFKSVAGKLSLVIGLATRLWGVVSSIGGVFSRLVGIVSRVVRGFQLLFSNITITPVTRIGQAFASLQRIVRLVSGIFSQVSSVIMGAITSLAGAIGAPVGAVVAVIVAIFSSVIAYAVTHWEEFKSKILGIWETIKEEASAIWNSLKDGFISIWENLKAAIEPLVEKFNVFKEKLMEFGSYVSGTPVFQFLVGLLTEIGRVIVDTVVPAVQGIIRVFSTVFQAVWGVVVNVFNGIVNIISSALGAAMDIIGGILDVIKGIFTGDLELIWDGVCSIFGGIYDFISTTLSSILGVVGSILSGVLDIFVSIWEAIWNTVKGFVDGIFDAVSEVLRGISETAASICDVVKSGFDSAIEFITSLPGKALQWGKDFIGGLVDGIKGAIGMVTDAVKGVADKIKSFLHFSVPDEGPLTDYESWMPDFMQGLAEGINSSSEVVTAAITNFTSQVKQSLNADVMVSFQTFSQQWVAQMKVIVTSTQQMATGVGAGMKVIVTATQQSGQGYTAICKSILTITTTTVTGATTQYTKMATMFTKTITTMTNTQKTGFNAMLTVTNTTFMQMGTIINTSMQKAVSAVQSAVSTMKSTMNFQWQLPHLKVPHINVSGNFNLDPPSAPDFNVNWYAKGGVFDEPSLIGVGEAGKEAVMPLENNTGWINDLAVMISSQLANASSQQFTPVGNNSVNNTTNNSEDRYMTSNVTNNNTTAGNTDNSITFAEGAIQINCQNASEEEAIRMAKVIMEYIKRQKELDKMLAYG